MAAAVPRDARRPAGHRRPRLGHAAFILVRITLACAAFTLVAALLGAPALAVGGGRRARRRPVRRGRIRRADHGVLGAAGERRQLQPALPVRDHPDVPVRGHVLPDRPAARDGCSRSAWVTPLWHGDRPPSAS